MKTRYIPVWAVIAAFITSCINFSQNKLDEAESLILTHPDSAIALLENIEPYSSWNDSAKNYVLDNTAMADAKWGLLHTWASYRLYRPYIEETPLSTAFSFYKDRKNNREKALAYFLHSTVHEDQHRGTPEEWEKDLYDACLIMKETVQQDKARNTHLLATHIYYQYAAKLGARKAYEEAIFWDSIALKEAKDYDDTDKTIITLINYSTHLLFYYENKGIKECPQAFRLINEARNIAIQKGLKADEGRVYGRMSNFFSRRQELDSALYYALKAVRIDEQQLVSKARKEAVRYTHVADAYFKLGMADSALHYAMKDLSNPSLITRRNASQLLFQIYNEQLHDYKEAIKWQHMHEKQSDSLQWHNVALATGKLQQDNNRLIHKMEEKQRGLGWGIILATILCLIIIVLFVRLRLKNIKKLHQLEQEINQLLKKDNPQNSSSFFTNHDNPEITLVGSTRESITLHVDDILSLESESNYIRVSYIKDGEESHKILRMTMTQAEAQLQERRMIMRCHRAFMVNLAHVEHFSSSAGAYTLHLKNTTLHIPISRTYLPRIRQALANL